MVRLAEGRRMIAPDPAEEELKQTQIGIEGDTPMNLIKEKVMAKWNITHLNEKKVNADGVLKWRRRRMYGWWDKKKHWLHPEVHALQEDLPEKTPIADYDFETDKIVLTTQQCPTRQQNYDHAMFLIKVSLLPVLTAQWFCSFFQLDFLQFPLSSCFLLFPDLCNFLVIFVTPSSSSYLIPHFLPFLPLFLLLPPLHLLLALHFLYFPLPLSGPLRRVDEARIVGRRKRS